MSSLPCEAIDTVGALHPKAMPVMLDRNSFNRWLDDYHLRARMAYADENVMVL